MMGALCTQDIKTQKKKPTKLDKSAYKMCERIIKASKCILG